LRFDYYVGITNRERSFSFSRWVKAERGQLRCNRSLLSFLTGTVCLRDCDWNLLIRTDRNHEIWTHCFTLDPNIEMLYSMYLKNHTAEKYQSTYHYTSITRVLPNKSTTAAWNMITRDLIVYESSYQTNQTDRPTTKPTLGQRWTECSECLL